MWLDWVEFDGAVRLVLRLGPLCALAPFLGARRTPSPIRVGLCASLAWVWRSELSTPDLSIEVLAADASAGAWAAGASVLIFKGAEAAGRLLDVARGTHHAEVLSPQAGDRSSPLGRLAEVLTLAIFAEIHGPARTLWGLRRLALGPDELFRAWTTAFEAGFAIVLPAMTACLLTDLAFGLVARWASRLQAFVLALGPKSLVGLGVLALAGASPWRALAAHFLALMGAHER